MRDGATVKAGSDSNYYFLSAVNGQDEVVMRFFFLFTYICVSLTRCLVHFILNTKCHLEREGGGEEMQ